MRIVENVEEISTLFNNTYRKALPYPHPISILMLKNSLFSS